MGRMTGMRQALIGLCCLIAAGCSSRAEISARKVNLYQDWALGPGDSLGDYEVQSGLGDVAVDVRGQRIYMPFDGSIEPDADSEGLCIIVSSPEVPAYLFRLCGIQRPRLGYQARHTTIGVGQVIAFATLRRQRDGTWAMVEPAQDLLMKFLEKP